ncbi:MAG: phosphoribosylformylglycinamidine synthase, partial [Clostridia bacterium]|nr:phosphoribosylformylglycinamidine synthase [Clostridia bacterium]
MVYRIYVEKKDSFANEAKALYSDITSLIGIKGLKSVRVLNRYDVENIDKELFEYTKNTVFAEPQLDIVTEDLDATGAYVFAVEFLPGQFDQRADSAEQCIQIISKGERPTVNTAKVYLLYGELSDEEISQIKKHVINPVEAREASLEKKETLKADYEIPTEVETLHGFISLTREELSSFIAKYGLAMDVDDISFCQKYFIDEQRDPTIT